MPCDAYVIIYINGIEFNRTKEGMNQNYPIYYQAFVTEKPILKNSIFTLKMKDDDYGETDDEMSTWLIKPELIDGREHTLVDTENSKILPNGTVATNSVTFAAQFLPIGTDLKLIYIANESDKTMNVVVYFI